jgi:hypothetical protein
MRVWDKKTPGVEISHKSEETITHFPRITGIFPLQGLAPSMLSEICQIFGTVYRAHGAPGFSLLHGCDKMRSFRCSDATSWQSTILDSWGLTCCRRDPLFLSAMVRLFLFCKWPLSPAHNRKSCAKNCMQIGELEGGGGGFLPISILLHDNKYVHPSGQHSDSLMLLVRWFLDSWLKRKLPFGKFKIGCSSSRQLTTVHCRVESWQSYLHQVMKRLRQLRPRIVEATDSVLIRGTLYTVGISHQCWLLINIYLFVLSQLTNRNLSPWELSI